MDKIILEIERQIQRLQAAKQLLIDTQDPSALDQPAVARVTDINGQPVKRGRGRPRKHPLVAPAADPVSHSTAA